MDTPSLILTLGGCFLLAGTIVTTIAIRRAPMGLETEEGFFELPDRSDEHSVSRPPMPGATLHLN